MTVYDWLIAMWVTTFLLSSGTVSLLVYRDLRKRGIFDVIRIMGAFLLCVVPFINIVMLIVTSCILLDDIQLSKKVNRFMINRFYTGKR